MVGEKPPRSHARHGLLGRTGPHEDSQLSPSVEKVAAGASCIRALCTKAQMVPEHCQRARTSCTSSMLLVWQNAHTLVDGLRLHTEATGYAKRLLANLQTLAFVPEWTEQVANVEMEFGDVFRLGSKLNEWFLSLDLRQFRAAFFT